MHFLMVRIRQRWLPYEGRPGRTRLRLATSRVGSALWPVRRWLFALLVAGIGLLISVATGNSAAQTPPSGSVVRMQHDPAGRILLAVTASEQSLLAPGSVSVLVDGVPRAAKVTAPAEREPLPIVLAIDSSGSMAGAALTSAKSAANQLIAGVRERDPIAVVSFSDAPNVRARPGLNRGTASLAVQDIAAAGDTALYRAVDTATELASTSGPRGVVVLLSDGEDTTGSAEARRTSIERAAERGVPVFAFGLGAAIDAGYLEQLADATHGRFVAVANPNALVTLYSQLGVDLARATSVEVSVPPLPQGVHDVLVQLGQPRGGRGVTLSGRIEVDNTGLLRLAAASRNGPTGAITVSAESSLPRNQMELRYSIDGAAVQTPGNGPFQIDPWRRTPGVAVVEASAYADGQLLATASTIVTIPALEQQFKVETARASGGTQVTVLANTQSARPPTIVVREGRQVLLRTNEPQGRVVVPTGRAVIAELLEGDRVLASQALTAEASDAMSLPSIGLLTMLAAMLVGAAVVLARRQMRFTNIAVLQALSPAPRRRPVVQPPVLPEPGPARGVAVTVTPLPVLPRLVIREPGGQVRRLPLPPDVAFSIGSNVACDVCLEDEFVRPLHGLLTPFQEGHFVLQALGLPESGVDGPPSMLVVRPGEEVKVGRHVLVIE